MSEKDLQQFSKDLRPCPFCGGSAKITRGVTLYVDMYAVTCSQCYGGSMRFATGYHCITKKVVTAEEAIQKAIGRWNRRIEDAWKAGQT
ncbi:MAG: Lar family restriction alleviation protein [Oscillospiraceae bacterium]|nr:Lar family restriction alleviation protein [Oscillospiraceae bacterium]